MTYTKLLFILCIITSLNSCRTYSVNSDNITTDIITPIPPNNHFIDMVYQHTVFNNDGNIFIANFSIGSSGERIGTLFGSSGERIGTLSRSSTRYKFVSLYNNDPNKAIYSRIADKSTKYIGVDFDAERIPKLIMYKNRSHDISPWNNIDDVSFALDNIVDPKKAFALTINGKNILNSIGNLFRASYGIYPLDSSTLITTPTPTTTQIRYRFHEFVYQSVSRTDIIYQSTSGTDYIGIRYSSNSFPKLSMFKNEKINSWFNPQDVRFTDNNKVTFIDTIQGLIVTDTGGTPLTATGTKLVGTDTVYEFHSLSTKADDAITQAFYTYLPPTTGIMRYLGICMVNNTETEAGRKLRMYKRNGDVTWSDIDAVHFDEKHLVVPD